MLNALKTKLVIFIGRSNQNYLLTLGNVIKLISSILPNAMTIGGNKIRLIAVVKFQGKRVYIRHILSHKEYDQNKWKEG